MGSKSIHGGAGLSVMGRKLYIYIYIYTWLLYSVDMHWLLADPFHTPWQTACGVEAPRGPPGARHHGTCRGVRKSEEE